MPSYYKRKASFPQKKKNGNGGSGNPSDRSMKDVIDCWHSGKKGQIITDCGAKQAGRPKAPGAKRKVMEVKTMSLATLSAINIEALNCKPVQLTPCRTVQSQRVSLTPIICISTI